LRGEGFVVSEARDGREMPACLDRQSVSLITLDLTLGSDRSVPIIILIGKGGPIDRIVGLLEAVQHMIQLVACGAEDLSGKAPPFRQS
jgi:DNA-binding response OmpR family regulator